MLSIFGNLDSLNRFEEVETKKEPKMGWDKNDQHFVTGFWRLFALKIMIYHAILNYKKGRTLEPLTSSSSSVAEEAGEGEVRSAPQIEMRQE